MYSLSLTLEILFLPFPPLLWTPGNGLLWTVISQVPLSSGFQGVWPMGGIHCRRWGRGRRRIRQSGGERESSGYLFLQLLLCQVTFGNDDIPVLCAAPVGLSCSESLGFDQILFRFPLQDQDGSSFSLLLVQARCTALGPLYPAQTFSCTFQTCPLIPAWSLADTDARVELSHCHPGTVGQSTSLEGSRFLYLKKCSGGEGGLISCPRVPSSADICTST